MVGQRVAQTLIFLPTHLTFFFFPASGTPGSMNNQNGATGSTLAVSDTTSAASPGSAPGSTSNHNAPTGMSQGGSSSGLNVDGISESVTTRELEPTTYITTTPTSAGRASEPATIENVTTRTRTSTNGASESVTTCQNDTWATTSDESAPVSVRGSQNTTTRTKTSAERSPGPASDRNASTRTTSLADSVSLSVGDSESTTTSHNATTRAATSDDSAPASFGSNQNVITTVSSTDNASASVTASQDTTTMSASPADGAPNSTDDHSTTVRHTVDSASVSIGNSQNAITTLSSVDAVSVSITTSQDTKSGSPADNAPKPTDDHSTNVRYTVGSASVSIGNSQNGITVPSTDNASASVTASQDTTTMSESPAYSAPKPTDDRSTNVRHTVGSASVSIGDGQNGITTVPSADTVSVSVTTSQDTTTKSASPANSAPKPTDNQSTTVRPTVDSALELNQNTLTVAPLAVFTSGPIYTEPATSEASTPTERDPGASGPSTQDESPPKGRNSTIDQFRTVPVNIVLIPETHIPDAPPPPYVSLSKTTVDPSKGLLKMMDSHLDSGFTYTSLGKDRDSGFSYTSLRKDRDSGSSFTSLGKDRGHVLDKPDIETNMELLRAARQKDHDNTLYIPPQAKISLESSDDTGIPLMDMVEEFLRGKRKVFLLIGDSGAGKSTFSRELEVGLWRAYEAGKGRIPLYIKISEIEKPERDLIRKQLLMAGFTESEILEMKHQRKFILICDGFDEIPYSKNLYTSNQLNRPNEWNVQMVISCRTINLGVDYLDRFLPGDSESGLFQEAVIMPFSSNQVQTYIQSYVAASRTLLSTKDFMSVLRHIPSLKEVVRNPFLLTQFLEVLPSMMKPGQDFSVASVARVRLYDHFVEKWLDRGKKRLEKREWTEQERAAYRILCHGGLGMYGRDFLKRLSAAIYRQNNGPVVTYPLLDDKSTWKEEFFGGENTTTPLLLGICLLMGNGNQYRFIHLSLQEYGLALAVFDPHGGRDRGSAAPPRSGAAVNSDGPDPESPLAWIDVSKEPSVLHFLEERAQLEPMFKDQLLSYIDNPKTDSKWHTVALNAKRILNMADVDVQGHSTLSRNMQVSGADATHAVLESTLLPEMDASTRSHVQMTGPQSDELPIPSKDDPPKVVKPKHSMGFSGIPRWNTHQPNASKPIDDWNDGPPPGIPAAYRERGAQAQGLQHNSAQPQGFQLFGADQRLAGLGREDGVVCSCAYSPDGQSFAVGLNNSNINVYKTSNWERIETLRGHTGAVWSVVYSPTGDRIATASRDMTVILWDAGSGSVLLTLEHANGVRCVAFSPSGNQVASVSDDQTVKLWETATGNCVQTISDHKDGAACVAYSPNRKQVATGCKDNKVRLWNAGDRSCHELSGHTQAVMDVKYSPKGDLLASASEDKTVRLWNVTKRECSYILRGHENGVLSVAFSPKGDQLVSGGRDRTVRVWGTKKGSSIRTLTGHNGLIMSVASSPACKQVASGSTDKNVRLWNLDSK